MDSQLLHQMLPEIETRGGSRLLHIVQESIDLHCFIQAICRQRDIRHQVGAHHNAFKDLPVLQLLAIAHDADEICRCGIALRAVVFPLQVQYATRLRSEHRILETGEFAPGDQHFVVDQFRQADYHLYCLIDGIGHRHVYPRFYPAPRPEVHGLDRLKRLQEAHCQLKLHLLLQLLFRRVAFGVLRTAADDVQTTPVGTYYCPYFTGESAKDSFV